MIAQDRCDTSVVIAPGDMARPCMHGESQPDQSRKCIALGESLSST